ncbi:importin-9 [Microplitis demolitor]|uniref:importin-9 n=1 Tax=Microplitis demolitor TaxID=69319 RepID=UPI0004CD0F09|nr:importin-9 [Microplitis demolitor]
MMAMNMNTRDVQSSLKEALYETLSGILSPHRDTRHAAEQRIQALEVTDEFGIHLTEFVVDVNGALAIRQLSSVLLKQYVETHWCSVAEKFRAPEIKPATKEKIKELLPLGLHESISKVRVSVAYAIAAIAHWDWPENWPGLFDILVNCLSGGQSEYAVHGAMRVLSEFTRDLSDDNLPNVGPIILQEMYRIFVTETYSIRTRGRAVEIFTTIASLVGSTGVYHKGFVQNYLKPVIPMFCEKFVACLREQSPDGSPTTSTCDIGLKTDIIKAINCLVTKLPKFVAPFLPQILPPVWDTLTGSAKIYQQESVASETMSRRMTRVPLSHDDSGEGDDDHDGKENVVVDSDGEIINFNNLIIATFDFIHNLVDHKNFSNLLVNSLQEAMYYLIIFMQITNEQVELWTANPSQFVEEDEQTVFSYNVRISAMDLLTALVGHSEDASINALCQVITRHIEAVNVMQVCNRNVQQSNGVHDNTSSLSSSTPSSSWKICESAILALSIAKDQVIEQMQEGTLRFDLVAFLNTVILDGILNDPNAHPYLIGRCLCLGGRYAHQIPPELSSRFLEAAVVGLPENQLLCIRISSIKAVYWFCEAAIDANTLMTRDVIRPHLPVIFQELFGFVNQASTEILTLIMETFSILIAVDKDFTASVENKICPLTIAVFLKFQSDPEILSLCQDIFKELTENPQCIGPLQTRLVPTLVSMMTVNPLGKCTDEGTRGVALDVLQVLVKSSPQPLNNSLVETAFPAACHCIINSDDNGILQSGGELIRTYLSVGARQIIDHRDSEGRTGLQFVLQIVAQLLNPQSSEFTATFVGRLVITLIKKVGNNLGENLDLLLKAVLSKMQRAETLTVMQSLIMVYAHLLNAEFDAVLNFLSTVPGPTGESALAFVLTEWVQRQQSFFGTYVRKVTVVALSKILEHGVTRPDDFRLNEITVRGDQVFAANDDVIRTRSKAQSQPYQWTTIPVLVKIFKLIINELSNNIEADYGGIGDEDDEDVTQDIEDSEEEEDREDGTAVDDGGNAFIDPGDESYLMRMLDDDKTLEEETDSDLLEDSIYHLNLNNYLRDFLTNFSQHHCFPVYIQHLNSMERKILTSLNIISSPCI